MFVWCRQQTGGPGQQELSTPTLCHTSAPAVYSSVKSTGAISRMTGIVRTQRNSNKGAEGVKQVSCFGLAPSKGHRSFPEAGENFTIARLYYCRFSNSSSTKTRADEMMSLSETWELPAVSELKKWAQLSDVIGRSDLFLSIGGVTSRRQRYTKKAKGWLIQNQVN